MINARRYAVTETIGNGLKICIRASRPDDADRVVEAFHQLDKESIYLRFFGPKKEISETELQRFREVDFDRRVVLLGTIPKDGREIVIASCSYVRVGTDEAEVAFLVEEEYHRLGIARRMLGHMGKIATAAGIKTFIAEVLPHNRGMLGVFGRCGWPVQSHIADGTVHLRLALDRAENLP